MSSSPEKPEKSTEKVKRPSDKDLDLSNATRGVWLVKVPKYIAERWENGPQDTTQDVGKLKIIRRANQKPLVSFSLADNLTVAMPERKEISQKTPIPKDHKFVISGVASQTLAVFSHTAGDPDALVPVPDKLALEGKVAQRAECRPINDKVYMTLKRDAIIRAIEPERKTMSLKNPVNSYKPVSNHQFNKDYEAKKKSEGKKSRDDKDTVMEILFALFEKHQYFKIDDLVKQTKQPVTYLKEILKEVCVYNMKNPHKNMWELKPEFRHYKQEETEEKKDNADDNSSDDD
jgi:transcription initiation factor TFIIF subunit beta